MRVIIVLMLLLTLFGAVHGETIEPQTEEAAAAAAAAAVDHTAETTDAALRAWLEYNAPFLLSRPLLLENWQWIGLFLVIFIGFVVSQILTAVSIGVVHRWFSRHRASLDGTTEKHFVRPLRITLMAIIWSALMGALGLPPTVLEVLKVGAQSLAAAAAVWALYRLIDVLGEYMSERAVRTRSRYDELLVPLVVRTLKVFVLVFGIVFVAETLEFDYMSLLAGLGLGGLAFALAAKDTVSNIFGSLTVLLDRPFQIGDWIAIGDVEGTVESLGMRTTRIRTFYNSLVTVPNANFISANIDNLGARRYRRFMTTLNIAYDTPPEKIDAFCEGIREIVRLHPYTRKDFYISYLNDFGPSALNVLVWVFFEAPDWGTEVRERHRLMLDIIRLARQLSVEFAFPTQTLYMRPQEYEKASDRAPQFASEEEAMEDARRRARELAGKFAGGAGLKPDPVTFAPPEATGEAPGKTHRG